MGISFRVFNLLSADQRVLQMLVGRIFSIHLAFVEALIFVSISKNHIKKAPPKIYPQKPKMNHQIGLLK
jgi:hypothetical protein